MSVAGLMENRGRMALVLSAALGAGLAGVGDRLAKGGASATQSIAEMIWSDFHIGSQPERGAAMAFLVVVAALVTLVFDPSTKKAAFGIGVGLLTSGFTLVPYQERPAIGEIPTASVPAADAPGATLLDRLLGTSPAWAQPTQTTGNAHLVVQWEGSRRECTITILSLDRRQVVGRSRYLWRNEFTMPLPVGVYRLTIEAPGAREAYGQFRIVAGRTVELRARMGGSSAVQVSG